MSDDQPLFREVLEGFEAREKWAVEVICSFATKVGWRLPDLDPQTEGGLGLAVARHGAVALEAFGDRLSDAESGPTRAAVSTLLTLAMLDQAVGIAMKTPGPDAIAALLIAGARLHRADIENRSRPRDVIWGPSGQVGGAPKRRRYRVADDALFQEAEARLLPDKTNYTELFQELALRAQPNPGKAAGLKARLRRLQNQFNTTRR